jgi:RHS repeat-associated protein
VGGVTDQYSYSAFGELLEHVGTDLQPYRFAGEPFDPNIGLSYNRARWLDLASGRFASVDPFGGPLRDPISLHRYLYAKGTPTLAVDPTGQFSGFTVGEGLIVAAIVGTIFAAGGYLSARGQGVSRSEAALEAAKAFLVGAGVVAGVYAIIIGGQVLYVYAVTGGFTGSWTLYSTFRQATTYSVRLRKPLTVYRWWGGTADKAGPWFTTQNFATGRGAIEGLALNPAWGNTAQFVSRATIPVNTQILVGRAAQQASLPGGAVQVFVKNKGVVNFVP